MTQAGNPGNDSLIDVFEAPFGRGITGTLFDIAKKVGGSTFIDSGDRFFLPNLRQYQSLPQSGQ